MKDKLENLFIELSKKSNGQSQKLLSYFGLNSQEYDAVYPLSKLQHNIYIDSLLNTNPVAYNMGAYTTFEGDLNLDLWKEALQKNTDRDPVLRSVFVEKDGLIFQAVRTKVSIDFEYFDIRNAVKSTADVEKIMRTKVDKPYSMLSIVNRHAVYRVADDKYYLLHNAHQILLDVLSARMCMKNALDYYHKKEFDPVKEESSFQNYIYTNLEQFDKEESITFWSEKLKEAKLPELDSSVGLDNYTVESSVVSAEDMKAIKSYCRENIITPAVYFKGLFAVLLDYYSDLPERPVFFENLNGRVKPFLNTVGVLFHSVPVILESQSKTRQQSIDGLWDALKKQKKESNSYGQLSMKEIGQLTSKGLSCYFNYLNLQDADYFKHPKYFSPIENCGENELHFVVEQRADHFELKLLGSSLNFLKTEFLNRLQSLSDQIVSEKIVTVAELNFLLSDEEEKLREFGNWTGHNPVQESYLDHFNESLTIYKERTVVSFEGQHLTYQQLDERSNQLANHLTTAMQLKKGDLVGVLMERSHHTLVSILSILKAGGVYLPLDPSYPEERLDYIIEHANPAVILIGARNLGKLAGKHSNLFAVDLQINTLQTSKELSTESPDLTDLCYVIYTSGSTGKPKGVMIEHGGMSNHLKVKRDLMSLTENDVIAQTASESFDISVWQFLTAQLTGAATVVYNDEVIYSVEDLLERVNEDGVTILEVVPSYLRLILKEIKKGEEASFFKSLRYLMVTGEELDKSVANEWLLRFPGICLINAYGPTEASDDITHYVINEAQEDSVPIGEVVDNAAIYIVDNDQNLRPPGMKGEIMVSGQCLGRGYLHDEEKTKNSFVSANLDDKVRRMYKTGDIGSWRSDGKLMFHGRTDYQVKIQGNRIELSEIEKVLLDYEFVSDAVVQVRTNKAGDKQLVAFYTKTGNMTVGELREYLGMHLPDYMIPAYYKEMSGLQLTQNGKHDRIALQKESLELDSSEYIAPEGNVEAKLAEIWENILDVKNIGVLDNFFEIGGHSLSAMQVTSRIQDHFQTKIDLKQFFNAPTIRQLSVLIREDSPEIEMADDTQENELFI